MTPTNIFLTVTVASPPHVDAGDVTFDLECELVQNVDDGGPTRYHWIVTKAELVPDPDWPVSDEDRARLEHWALDSERISEKVNA